MITNALEVAEDLDYLKGSIVRGGRSVIAMGAAQQTVGKGATKAFTVSPNEPGMLDRLVIDCATLDDLTVSALTIDGDSLISGEAPGSMFAPDSVVSPYFGHRVAQNSRIVVTVKNNDASNDVVAQLGWSIAAFRPGQDMLEQAPTKGSIARGGRSVIAMGAAAQTVGKGATKAFTVSPNEPGVLDRLVIDCATIDDLTVSELTIDGDSLISGEVPAELFASDNVHSPVCGHEVNQSSKIVVTLKNNDAVNDVVAQIGFTIR